MDQFDWLSIFDSVGTHWAWPLVAVFLAVLFRGPIGGLLDRLSKLSSKGAEFHPGLQEVKLKKPEEAMNEEGPLSGSFNLPHSIKSSEVIMPQISNLAAQLKDLAHKAQPDNSEERENLIQYRLAQALIRGNFERAYGAIYGTQLMVLEAVEGGGSTNIKSLYEEHIRRVRDAFGDLPPASFRAWKEFLLSFEFVTGDDVMSITDFGRLFLVYIRTTGRSLRKKF